MNTSDLIGYSGIAITVCGAIFLLLSVASNEQPGDQPRAVFGFTLIGLGLVMLVGAGIAGTQYNNAILEQSRAVCLQVEGRQFIYTGNSTYQCISP